MDSPQDRHRKVLFICTGNLYRSRFAEILFNVLARDARMDWRAFSRGVRVPSRNDAAVPISGEAVRGLYVRGIQVDEPTRYPIQLTESDFEKANLVIVLNEIEHRPFLEKSFSGWANRAVYWSIEDFHTTPPDEAMFLIEIHVRSLMRRLSDFTIGAVEPVEGHMSSYVSSATKEHRGFDAFSSCEGDPYYRCLHLSL